MEDDPLSARDNQEQDIVTSDIEGVLFRKEEVEIFDPKILPNNYPAEPSTQLLESSDDQEELQYPRFTRDEQPIGLVPLQTALPTQSES